MGYKVVEFRQTPNPDALKCMVEPEVRPLGVSGPKRPRAYRSVDEAGEDALAVALFAVEGVAGVLIHEQWITVNKAAGAAWAKVKPGVEKALREAP